jgi:hypothetical protein
VVIVHWTHRRITLQNVTSVHQTGQVSTSIFPPWEHDLPDEPAGDSLAS